MSRAPAADTAQANRLRWFLAPHLLAVLLIFQTSMWVGQHLAARPDTLPAASPQPHREHLAAAPTPLQEETR